MLKEQFTAEEWATLEFAPLWAFVGVAGVDNEIDDKEKEALAQELMEWALYKEPLVQEVFLSVGQNLATTLPAFAADSRDLLTGLKDVADLLDRKVTPEQAHNFKGALILLARKVGEASGVSATKGADNVSDAEKMAVVMIGTALRFVPS
jgi:hypothetical protein